jgi:predicted methyltransferase
MRSIPLFALVWALSVLPSLAQTTADAALQAAVHGANRQPKFVSRDEARHPIEELSFFGVRPDAAVVEIWPGGGYWTEILAPYLRDRGRFTVALERKGVGETAEAGSDTTYATFRAKLGGEPALYGAMAVTVLGPQETAIVPPGTADVVLTFRNLHNWMKAGTAEEVLAAFYKALKPGGILGIEEHRGQRKIPQDPRALDGYVAQDYAIALVERAGFTLVATSEINANPKDTADWPKGVWTLPPTYALGDQDRATYAAIGEADNFVLKFRKPTP